MPTVRCPSCGRALHLPEAQQGCLARCPLCQTPFPTAQIPRVVAVARPVLASRPPPPELAPFDFEQVRSSETLSSDDRLALRSAVRFLKAHAGLGLLQAFTCNCVEVLTFAAAPPFVFHPFIGLLLRIGVLVVVFSGAETLERRRNRGLAKTAGVLALLLSAYLLLGSCGESLRLALVPVPRRGIHPLDSSFLLLSMAVSAVTGLLGVMGGVKTLTVLGKPEVSRLFDRSEGKDPFPPP